MIRMKVGNIVKTDEGLEYRIEKVDKHNELTVTFLKSGSVRTFRALSYKQQYVLSTARDYSVGSIHEIKSGMIEIINIIDNKHYDIKFIATGGIVRHVSYTKLGSHGVVGDPLKETIPIVTKFSVGQTVDTLSGKATIMEITKNYGKGMALNRIVKYHDSGIIKEESDYDLRRGACYIDSDYSPGKEFTNKHGDRYTIIAEGTNSKEKHKRLIRFDKTGTEEVITVRKISLGTVKDKMKKEVVEDLGVLSSSKNFNIKKLLKGVKRITTHNIYRCISDGDVFILESNKHIVKYILLDGSDTIKTANKSDITFLKKEKK